LPQLNGFGPTADPPAALPEPLPSAMVGTFSAFNRASPAAIADGNGSGNAAGGSAVGPNPFSWGNTTKWAARSATRVHSSTLTASQSTSAISTCVVLLPDQGFDLGIQGAVQQPRPGMGKFSGGVVNLSTKGGTNQYHGELLRVFPQQSSQCKAIFFSATKSPLRAETSMAPRFGGPVIKDKTFFFFAWDAVPSAGIHQYLLQQCPRWLREAACSPRECMIFLIRSAVSAAWRRDWHGLRPGAIPQQHDSDGKN